MKIHLLAVGERMPEWVRIASDDYLGRLARWQAIDLVEITPGERGRKSDPRQAMARESERLLAAVPQGAWVIALDERGQSWSSEQLSQRLQSWRNQGRDVAMLVGGPDGHAPEVIERADQRWSLSPLTLPHALVRVLLAEQIYRAASMLENHPYHRA